MPPAPNSGRIRSICPDTEGWEQKKYVGGWYALRYVRSPPGIGGVPIWGWGVFSPQLGTPGWGRLGADGAGPQLGIPRWGRSLAGGGHPRTWVPRWGMAAHRSGPGHRCQSPVGDARGRVTLQPGSGREVVTPAAVAGARPGLWVRSLRCNPGLGQPSHRPFSGTFPPAHPASLQPSVPKRNPPSRGGGCVWGLARVRFGVRGGARVPLRSGCDGGAVTVTSWRSGELTSRNTIPV